MGCSINEYCIVLYCIVVFTARLHLDLMLSTVLRRPFCRSVCLYVKRVDCDKTKETYAHILIPLPYERTFILVFRHEEGLVVDDPLYLKFWAKLTPFEQKRKFSIDFRS